MLDTVDPSGVSVTLDSRSNSKFLLAMMFSDWQALTKPFSNQVSSRFAF